MCARAVEALPSWASLAFAFRRLSSLRAWPRSPRSAECVLPLCGVRLIPGPWKALLVVPAERAILGRAPSPRDERIEHPFLLPRGTNLSSTLLLFCRCSCFCALELPRAGCVPALCLAVSRVRRSLLTRVRRCGSPAWLWQSLVLRRWGRAAGIYSEPKLASWSGERMHRASLSSHSASPVGCC